jgi:hypothetical protein
VFYSYQSILKWPIIKFLNAQGPILYVDTKTVIYYADCFSQVGYKVFAEGQYCANWNYGSTVLRFINLFSITNENIALIGHFFTYSILITFVYSLYLVRGFNLAQITMFCGFISPSVWLLMERANFDALIYILVFLAAILYKKNFQLLSVVLIFITALFKFYTLPLLAILPFLSHKFSTKIVGFAGFVSGVLIVSYDLKLMNGMSMQAGNNHFGMRIIGNYLGKVDIKLDLNEAYFLGLILFLAAIILVFFAINKFEVQFFRRKILLEKNELIYLFMSSIFLTCFIAGLSVDYRLIFYLVSAPMLIPLLKTQIRFVLSGCFLVGAWLCYPSGFFQTIGDLSLELLAAFQMIVVFLYLSLRKSIFSKIRAKSTTRFIA